MSLELLSGPTGEPVTLAEARAQLRLTTSDQESAPTAPTAALAGVGAGLLSAGVYRYKVTFVTLAGETDGGAASGAVTVSDPSTNGKVALSAIPLGSGQVTARRLWRTVAGGASYRLLATLADNTTETYTDNVADAALGAAVPTSNTTGDPQDAVIEVCIAAARSAAEQITRRQLMTAQYRLTLDRFPWPGATDYGGWPPIGIGLLNGGGRGIMTSRLASWYTLELPKAPLKTVDEIKYLDSLGVQQTLTANTDYVVDAARAPARLAPAYGKYWPSTLPQINAVQVTYTAGYGTAADVPAAIKAWMKLMIGALYENRELIAVINRGSVADLPFVDGLLDEFRVGYSVDYSVR